MLHNEPVRLLLLGCVLGMSGCAAGAANTPAATAASGAEVAAPPTAGPPTEKKPPLPRDIVARSELPIYAVEGERRLSEAELWPRLAAERVICFGEEHSNPHHHYAQYRALRELIALAAQSGKKLGAGFEMFQRPYQPALDAFVSGGADEPAFLAQSEYDKRWGFDFSLYRPLLEASRDAKLDALALNAPKELTRKIGRGGLAALDASERAQLPELDLTDAKHRDYFDAAMAGHPMPEGGPKPDDMYAAQVTWDETMADTAAAWLKRNPDDAQLVIFAGLGHCHQRAVPARIERRTGVGVLSVRPVLASALADSAEARALYDLDLVLDDSGGAAP